MKAQETVFPNVRIPYGTWGNSYFPAWQTSPLAEVNIGQFAGEAMGRILGKRKVPRQQLEYLVVGSTVPYHWKFWTAPMVAYCMGRRLPGCHVEQACATGLQAICVAAGQVQSGTCNVAGVLTYDRTSDSSVGIFPERRAPQRTVAIGDVWDNFGFDPSTGGSMLASAGLASRKYKLDRKEVDEVTAYRYEQYYEAKKTGFLERTAFPLEVLNMQGKPMGRIDDDLGVRRVSLDSLRAMRELDTCVTGGTQTHPSDGLATLLVSTPAKAKELSPKPEIDIQLVAKVEIRTSPGLMPEAPALAVQKLLERTGLAMDDMKVVKNHNPFAANDVIFSKVMGYDWHKMDRTGCSLVWGHPHAATLARTTIEGLEEAVSLGGGYVLIFGCAAGDVGIAAVFKVS
jgi:acetyl-CoA acetyltransferase